MEFFSVSIKEVIRALITTHGRKPTSQKSRIGLFVLFSNFTCVYDKTCVRCTSSSFIPKRFLLFVCIELLWVFELGFLRCSRDTDSIVYLTILLLSFIKGVSFLFVVTRYHQKLCSLFACEQHPSPAGLTARSELGLMTSGLTQRKASACYLKNCLWKGFRTFYFCFCCCCCCCFVNLRWRNIRHQTSFPGFSPNRPSLALLGREDPVNEVGWDF